MLILKILRTVIYFALHCTLENWECCLLRDVMLTVTMDTQIQYCTNILLPPSGRLESVVSCIFFLTLLLYQNCNLKWINNIDRQLYLNKTT